MSRKALITGASGLLGRRVVKAFDSAGWQVTGTAFTRASPPALLKVDLCDEAAIEEALQTAKPDVVVHCAAQRFPDKVDQDPSAARALNVEATLALARSCAAHSTLLIYISTDYVFPGAEGEAPYEADATPHPPNQYGQLKLDGEKAVLETMAASGLGVVLRVPVLYGPAETPKESAINTLLDSVYKAQKETVVMDDWSIRYPTHTEDVGHILAEIAAKYLNASASTTELKTFPRILQFSSEDRYTKYEICELLAEVLGLPMGKMEANKQGNDPSASVKRPYDCHLSTKALKGLGLDVVTQDFKAWWRWQLHAHR